MSVQRSIVGACVAAMLLAGCGERGGGESTSTEQGKSGTTVTGQDVANKAQEAADAAAQYATQKKDEIMAKLQDEYAALKPKIETLKTKAQNAGAQASTQLTRAVNDLEVKRAAFETELKKLKDSSGDAWKKIADGANSAWLDLKEAFDQASNELTGEKTE